MASELSPNHNTLLHVFCATNMRFSNTVLDSCNVGYTGKATAAGYYLTVPMFQGTDGEGIIIKDIVPTTTDAAGIEAGDFAITLMKTDRSPLMTYTYKPYKVGKGGSVTLAGWYDEDNKLDETTKVTYGEGFMLYSKKQVTLTFAGQVVQDAPRIVASVAGGYYRAGNITPVQVCIKDLIPTADAIEAGDFAISTYDKDRLPVMTWTYKPYKVGKGGSVTLAGWYDEDNKLDETKTFESGEGFVLYTKKSMTLTFPNPVKSAE